MQSSVFHDFAAHKTRDAASAHIERLSTAFELRDGLRVEGIGNAWSRRHYGGDFGLVSPDRLQTAVSLVFIQTKDGNDCVMVVIETRKGSLNKLPFEPRY